MYRGDGRSRVMAKGLAPSQQEDFKQLLSEFPDVAGEKLGRTTVIQHEIRVMDSEPIHQQPYKVRVARKGVIKKKIDNMLDMGIIQPSTSLLPQCWLRKRTEMFASVLTTGS